MSVRLLTTFRGKRDFLGPYLRKSFATYGCFHPCFLSIRIIKLIRIKIDKNETGY